MIASHIALMQVEFGRTIATATGGGPRLLHAHHLIGSTGSKGARLF